MSHNITVEGGKSVRLLTAGKYCDRDIVVTAEGGFTPPESEVLTPEFVYKTTRPKDWLPMPRPTDHEIYLLGLILPGKKSYFAAAITFTGSCVVEFGTVIDGVFVAKESYTPASGTAFSYTLEYDNYGDEILDGSRQYMARVYGTSVQTVSFPYGEVNCPMPLIVDVACGMALERFNAGKYNASRKTLNQLRYLNFVGNGKPGWINGDAFVGGCNALLSVGCEAKNDSTYGAYSLYTAGSVQAVSENLYAGITGDMNYAFANTQIAGVSLGNVQTTGANNLFRDSKLVSYTADTIDLSKCTNISYLFYQCRNLRYALGVNISSATEVFNMFTADDSLARLTFAGETTPGGWTIDLTTAVSLDHDALVEMIASLPTATAAATIAIAGVPGASELTDAEIAVATAKNWTITR